jgi:hypothetical protein
MGPVPGHYFATYQIPSSVLPVLRSVNHAYASRSLLGFFGIDQQTLERLAAGRGVEGVEVWNHQLQGIRLWKVHLIDI